MKTSRTGKQSKRDILDKLFSISVRARGVCEDDREGHECAGARQCAHGFSRRYNGTRWDPRNCFCLCARSHVYYDSNPIQKEDFMVRKMGQELYNELRRQALVGRAPREHELDELIARLSV